MSYASNDERYRRSAHAAGRHAAGGPRVSGVSRVGAHAIPEDVDDSTAPRRCAAPVDSLQTLSAGQGARVTVKISVFQLYITCIVNIHFVIFDKC